MRRIGHEGVLQQVQSDLFLDWWSRARRLIPKSGRRGFDSLVVLISWLLWKERNDRTFDRQVRTLQEVVARVYDEITVWSQAGYRQLESLFSPLVAPTGREIRTG